MKNFNNFTKLYPLSKTLRFELIPQGETLNHIKRSGILDNDNQRAESYKSVKKIIDEYHKAFIESVLAELDLPSEDEKKKESQEEFKNLLKEFHSLYLIKPKDDKQKTQFTKVQDTLRKRIASRFSAD